MSDHPPHIHEAARAAYSEALRDGDSTAIADAIVAAEQRAREEAARRVETFGIDPLTAGYLAAAIRRGEP